RLVLVDNGLWRVAALRELEAAVVLQLRVGGLGLGRGEVSLRLFDLRLELDLLDLVEKIAGLDGLPLVEQDLLEEALDTRPEVDLVYGLDMADEHEGLVHPLHRRRANPDGRFRRRCRGRGLAFVAARHESEEEAECADQLDTRADKDHCVRTMVIRSRMR